jgi:hypothetical protein
VQRRGLSGPEQDVELFAEFGLELVDCCRLDRVGRPPGRLLLDDELAVLVKGGECRDLIALAWVV